MGFLDVCYHYCFPVSPVGKESACNAGDLGSIPWLGRSPGEGKATHSSILAWRIYTVHRSQRVTRLNDFHFHNYLHELPNTATL